MKLYHGSTSIVKYPLVAAGRNGLDFGKGFYLTSLEEQAARWTARVKLLGARNIGYINEYSFDIEKLSEGNYRRINFDSYNRDWLEFVVSNRKGGDRWKQYDVVEGGVANDQVIDTVENYLSGVITAEQALGKLVYAKPNHQICILNQEVIDRCLTFEAYREL